MALAAGSGASTGEIVQAACTIVSPGRSLLTKSTVKISVSVKRYGSKFISAHVSAVDRCADIWRSLARGGGSRRLPRCCGNEKLCFGLLITSREYCCCVHHQFYTKLKLIVRSKRWPSAQVTRKVMLGVGTFAAWSMVTSAVMRDAPCCVGPCRMVTPVITAATPVAVVARSERSLATS